MPIKLFIMFLISFSLEYNIAIDCGKWEFISSVFYSCNNIYNFDKMPVRSAFPRGRSPSIPMYFWTNKISLCVLIAAGLCGKYRTVLYAVYLVFVRLNYGKNGQNGCHSCSFSLSFKMDTLLLNNMINSFEMLASCLIGLHFVENMRKFIE